jgi:hypothetical protein
MDFFEDEGGVSGEALKLAAALILGAAVLTMLATFALGPKRGETAVREMGSALYNSTQTASEKILGYK